MHSTRRHHRGNAFKDKEIADGHPYPTPEKCIEQGIATARAYIDPRYLRVVISNSLLAVGAFFKEHDMAAMRTPEVQFLGHIYDAILNENTFTLAPDYLPVATFDGLVIDSKLNGRPVFGDGVTEGFMEFGDALALLNWFSRFLRGEKNFVSGGDAG